jgi:hypothetical protein
MKTFRELFDEHIGNGILKWSHYPEIYDRHFNKYRELPITFLEIGSFKWWFITNMGKVFSKGKDICY